MHLILQSEISSTVLVDTIAQSSSEKKKKKKLGELWVVSPFRNLFPESYRTIVLDLFFRVFLFFPPYLDKKLHKSASASAIGPVPYSTKSGGKNWKISQSHPSRLGQQVAAGCADIPTTASLFPTQQGNNVITAKRERYTLALGDSDFDGRKRGKKKKKKSVGDEGEFMCVGGVEGILPFLTG